ncbi:MAG: hypothetical protein EPO26_05755 [Chloroflexota bacterium]|nr:MAG: hypothetical protein EPO26_05755 [Chloroflexota bacterium]
MDTVAVTAGDAAASPLDRRLDLPGVSLEMALYVLLIVVGLFARLWMLGELPLSPDETRVARAALNPTADIDLAGIGAGSFHLYGTALLFAVFGAADTTARLSTALLGSLAPVAMLLGRVSLGRGPAAIAAVALTFSPLMLDQARTVPGAGVGAIAALALVFIVTSGNGTKGGARGTRFALALALALTSGHGAVSGLAAIGIAFALARATGKRTTPSARSADNAPRPDAVFGVEAIAFVGVFGFLATGGFIHLDGIYRGVVSPFGDWTAAVVRRAMIDDIVRGLLLVAGYAALPAALGVWRIVRNLRRLDDAERVLGIWLVIGIVATLQSGGDAGHALSIVVPGTLLAARVIADALVVADHWRGLTLTGITIAWWGATIISLGIGHVSLPDPVAARYLAPVLGTFVSPESANEVAIRAIVIVPIALTLAAALYLWRQVGARAWPALGFGVITLLIARETHVAWNLAYNALDNRAELPRSLQTSVDVRALAADANAVSQVLTIARKDRVISIPESLRDPLEWYLRGSTINVNPVPSGNPAMVVLDAETKALAGRYTGQRYRSHARGSLAFENAAEFWRWIAYREAPDVARATDVVLYVRAQ